MTTDPENYGFVVLTHHKVDRFLEDLPTKRKGACFFQWPVGWNRANITFANEPQGSVKAMQLFFSAILKRSGHGSSWNRWWAGPPVGIPSGPGPVPSGHPHQAAAVGCDTGGCDTLMGRMLIGRG